MSSFNVEIADVQILSPIFTVLVFAAITSAGGIVMALLMGPVLPR